MTRVSGTPVRPYGLTGVPETRVIKRDGKFGTKFPGAVTAPELERAINRALEA